MIDSLTLKIFTLRKSHSGIIYLVKKSLSWNRTRKQVPTLTLTAMSLRQQNFCHLGSSISVIPVVEILTFRYQNFVILAAEFSSFGQVPEFPSFRQQNFCKKISSRLGFEPANLRCQSISRGLCNQTADGLMMNFLIIFSSDHWHRPWHWQGTGAPILRLWSHGGRC